jgi:hypothetical protein
MQKQKIRIQNVMLTLSEKIEADAPQEKQMQIASSSCGILWVAHQLSFLGCPMMDIPPESLPEKPLSEQ